MNDVIDQKNKQNGSILVKIQNTKKHKQNGSILVKIQNTKKQQFCLNMVFCWCRNAGMGLKKYKREKTVLV